MLFSGSVLGCEGTSPPPTPRTSSKAAESSERLNPAQTTPAGDAGTAAKQASEPRPPPPTIQGATFDPKSGLYVQRCGDKLPCRTHLQQGAMAACQGLTLGAAKDWRLPTKAEFSRIKNLSELHGARGYHWTSTAYAQDAAQFWIMALDSSPSTTIPGTRKAFTARCVRTHAP